jgi:hypothetical protein
MKPLIILCIASLLILLLVAGMAPFPAPLIPLDVITVDTAIDSNASIFQACTAETDDDCSLRGAISRSNGTTGGIGTINVPAGVYQLTLIGGNEYNNDTGDLDILQPVSIVGDAGMGTFIQAGSSSGMGIDRVFDLYSNDISLNLLTIRWGKAVDGSGAGVAINNYITGITLSHVVITENQAEEGNWGAGIATSGEVTISNSIISDNVADGEAGGIIQWSGGALTIRDTTISGNTGKYGGGIEVRGDAFLHNVTISGNSAIYSGGGISEWGGGNVTLYNTTVANNSVTGGSMEGWAIYDADIFNAYNSILSSSTGNSACVYGVDAGDHNIATDSSCGTTGFLITDPLLGSLADNGGLTWTHALLTGSLAIDAGDNTTCELVDQRGILRPFDGNHDGTATCDIGAYELAFYQFLPLLVKP